MSDIAFEAADHLSLAHSLGGATTHVCLGPLIMTKSDDNNAMECPVGMAVAASVEPMPVGLAGGSRDGIDTAQGGEGSLGVEMVRVTPGSNEEGRGRVWSYAEAIHQGWGCRPCECRWISASRSFISLLS